jgi:hypothetical protein
MSLSGYSVISPTTLINNMNLCKSAEKQVHNSLPTMTKKEPGPVAKESYRKSISEEIYGSMLKSDYSPLLNKPPH